ncbi:glycosyltransferase family 32 protein [Suillus clintonianus]|uniref:glycosyltransferase family 32 protein n=1 Tax=Suillus clintonianus TaxID=1904413 RepID=UPI001B864F3C|nr:glycosyltransferase family 32 protein [Suillus clintonianus]KAG2134811.1 glycosyltransferase family 32 protein [Suillus clintonianus]
MRLQRGFRRFLKFALPLVFIIGSTVYYLYEPHGSIGLVLHRRDWIQRELLPLSPLAGCFEPERVSPLYNVSDAVYGGKRFEVQAGVPMRMGMDCYELAGIVRFAEGERKEQEQYILPEERAQFHTYWRDDLVLLGERQEYMLKSFFATQDLPRSRLVLWSNGDLSLNSVVQKYLELFPGSFTLQIVNIPGLAKGTAMENHRLLNLEDKKAWVDGDLVRLLVIWTYGGAWIDMDMLLTRDLSPLLEHEFVTQWDCYDKIYQPFNGALMHFRKHSPYLCEAFHLMAHSTPPRSPSTDWGSVLYHRLWRRLLNESIPPFKILPFCFSDPLVCRLDNRAPEPFEPDRVDGKWTGRSGEGLEEGGALDRALGKIFAVHLHNRWDKAFPKGGWVDRLLLKRHEEEMERKVRMNGEF